MSRFKNEKVVLIGAGSAVFGLGTINDIFQSDTLVGSTIFSTISMSMH